MKPADNSLEQSYAEPTPGSSLEAQAATQPSVVVQAGRSQLSLFRYNKLAFLTTAAAMLVVVLVGVGTLLLTSAHGSPPSGQSTAQKASNYAVTTLPTQGLAAGSQLTVGEADHLAINGQLQVSNTLVLTPMAVPATPTAGQIYYNRSTNAPYYYNGSQFISLAPTALPQYVSSVGGSSGTISVGNGLQVTSGQLGLTNAVVQSLSNLSGGGVTSLQGQTGAVSLVGGNGITVNGTTISNGGVVSLVAGSSSIVVSNDGNGNYTLTSSGLAGSGTVNQIALFTGSQTLGGSILSQNGSSLVDSGDLTVSGAVSSNTFEQTAAGNNVNVSAGTDNLVFTAGGRTFMFPTSGPSSQVICTTGISCASGGGQGVLLQPGSAQLDTGSGSSIFINNNGGGDLLELQGAGSDRFVVTNGGNTTIGGTLAVQGAGGVTVGVPGTTTGNLNLANSTSTREVVLQGLNPSGTGNATIQIPTIAGGATDTVCLLSLGNCVGSGGGVTASGGTQNFIPKFTNAGANQLGNSLLFDNGVSVGVGTSTPSASYKLDVNGNLHASGSATVDTGLTVTAGGATISAGGLAVTGNSTIAGSLGSLTGLTSSGTITFSGLSAGGVVHANGSGVLSTGPVVLGTDTSGNYVASLGGLTGLSTTGNSGAGSTPTLSVLYGSGANTAAQGNSALSFTGAGNLTGTVSGTAGGGLTTNTLAIVNSPTFSGSLTVQGANALTLGTASTNTGAIVFKGSGGVGTLTLQGPTTPNTGNFTLAIPAITANDTVCVQNVGNCTASGAAGGDLTGSYPNPTIAKLQGKTLTVSATPSTGSVLQYNGSAFVDGLVTNTNLQAGTFSNITGTGALTTGSIASGFGTISTANNITTTATIQGNIVNATGGGAAIELNGTNINTAGTLSNVAYLNQANNFTAANTFSAAGTALSVTNNASIGGTLNGQTISSAANFTGSLAVQGAAGLTIGVPGTTTGNLNLANSTSTREVVLQGLNPSGTGNATIQIPTIAGGATDTVCLLSLGNCVGTGGGITGSGTSGIIAKFSGPGSITNSTLSESGTTLTASGNVAIQGSSSLTLGTASANTGSIAFKNSTNANTITLQAGASGSNFTLTLPTTHGNNGDCLESDGTGVLSFASCTGGAGGGVTSLDGLAGVLTLNNSSGAGSAITINNAAADGTTKGIATFNATNFTASGGVVNTIQDIASGSTPSFAGLNLGSPLTVANGGTGAATLALNGILYGNGTSPIQATSAAANSVLATNGSNVPSLTQTLPTAVQGNITGTGALTTGSIASGFGTISTANNITTTATIQGNIVNATGGGAAIELGGTNINTAGTLSNVAYLNQANNFTAANTFSAAGTALSVTNNASIGGTLNGQTISSAANFTGSLAVQGSGGVTVGSTTNVGIAKFLDGTSDGFTTSIQSAVQANNVALTIPADTHTTDTICLATLSNCTASGAAGGDLTGSYPNPTIAKLQGTTLTLSSLSSGQVLQYNGSAVVNGFITNSNLQAGSFTNITGTGALTSGSIGSGFGTISTGNNISTTAALQGATAVLTGANALTLGTASANTGAIVFNGAGGAGTLTLAGPTIPNAGNFTLSIPAITANANICTDNSICAGYQAAPVSGSYLQQVPTTTAQNTVTPTTNSVVGLTVNATSGTAAAAAIFNQSQAADGLQLNATNTGGTQTNGILVNRNGTGGTTTNGLNVTNALGTTTNGLQLTQSGGTFTNGINFTGTFTNLLNSTNLTIANSGNITNSGTYNTNTFNSNTLQFGAAGTATVQSAAGQALTVTANAASTWSTSAGNLTIQAATTNTLALDTGGAGTVAIGNANATTISLGTNAVVHGIQIGTGAAAQTITIGSTNTTSTTTLQAGSGGIVLGSISSANNAAYLCRNTSNQIAACNTTGTGAAFVQGGNSFGATAELGTNDANNLNFRTNNADRLTLDTSGNLQFLQASTINIAAATTGTQLAVKGGAATSGTNTGGNLLLEGGAGASTGASGSVIVQSNGTNSTTAFQVQNASSADLFNVDSANSNVSILTNNTGETQAWQTNANNLTAARRKHATIAANGYLYVLGGVNSGGTDQTTVMDAKINANGSTGTWANDTNSLPAARSVGASVTINGYLYYLGGSNTDTVMFSKINTDGTPGVWKCQGTAGPCGTTPVNNNSITGGATGLSFHSAFTANGYIYVVGSNGSNNATTYFARAYADGTTGAWSTTASLSAVRNLAGLSVANGYVYLVGGEDGSGNPEQTTFFAKINNDGSGTLQAWQCQGSSSGVCGGLTPVNNTSLPVPTSATSMVSSNGYLYLIGGENGTGVTSVYYTSLNANGTVVSWTLSNNALPSGLFWEGTAVSNGYIYATGGSSGGVGSPTVLQSVYYTSLSRISVAGSLDLIGTSGQDQLDNGGQGGSLTAGNTIIAGTLNVGGAANFMQGLSVAGDAQFGGSALFQNANNSTNAFQVQNAAGTGIFNVDTTNGRVGIGNTAPGNLLSIGALTTAQTGFQIAVSTGGTTNSGIVVQDVLSQSSGNVFQAEDSTGASLAKIDYLGNLTVKAATVNGNLTLNGHLITGNSSGSTSGAKLSALGTTGSCSVTGDDTTGTITMTSGGSGTAAGNWCTITFGSGYAVKPTVVVGGGNGNGSDADAYVDYVTLGATSMTQFTVGSVNNSNLFTGNIILTYIVAQ